MAGSARQRARQRSQPAVPPTFTDNRQLEAGPSNSTETPSTETLAASLAAAVESTRRPASVARPSIEPASPIPTGNPPILPTVEQTTLSIVAQHEQLKRQLLEKRLRDEIPLMEAELRGERPARAVDIEGTSHPFRYGRDDDENLSKHAGKVESKRFSGKSTAELQIYISHWQARFETMPDVSEPNRIKVAALSLDGTASNKWSTRDKEIPIDTWDEYIDFLKDVIQAPGNRTKTALLGAWRSRQRDDESITDFCLRKRLSRDNIPEMTKDQEFAWMLLIDMRLDVAAAVMSKFTALPSSNEVEEEAHRQEGILNNARGGSNKRVNKDTSSGGPSKRGAKGSHSTRGGGRSGGSTSLYSKNDSLPDGYICYGCGKPGHYRRDCTTPQGTSKQVAATSKPKNKGKERERDPPTKN